MELRVHGIGSHQPYQVFGAPILEFGDRRNGTYEMPERSRDDVHAFVWSRTTRRRLGIYRYALLPFTLLNVAGYAQTSASDQDDLGGRIYRTLVQFLGLTLTISYIYWLWAACADLPRVHGASADFQASMFVSVLVIVLGPILFRVLIRRGTNYSTPHADAATPVVGTSAFWSKRPARAFHLGHLLGSLALLEAINLATGWRQDLLMTLVAIQIATILVLGAVVLRRIRQPGAPERGGLVLLLLAVALPHAILGSILLATTSTVEAFHMIEASDSVGLLVLRPTPYWQFIATYFAIALAYVAWRVVKRVSVTQANSQAELDRTRQDYGVPADSTPTWLTRLTRDREQPLIRGIPQDLLDNPKATAWILVLAAVGGWNGVFSASDNFLTSLFRPLLGDYWYWLTLILMVVVTSATVFFFRSHGAQKQAAMIFDVLGFWPRAYHPLCPPAYAELTLTRLAESVARVDTRPLFLIGHSQGSVLSYCAAWRLEAQTQSELRLITCGSPLKSVYERLFPRYFGSKDFDLLASRLASWRNLHRDTDPIATSMFGTYDGDIRLLENHPEIKLDGHSNYWEDPQMSTLVVSADGEEKLP